ncbi:hypothetical protein F5B22DRAFT_272246 [Xylaria bambusicola]|uniref:uncharacterized protein n=1 Tax=Xylaria bambusicola TaxID=326684 RepID=UPI0020080BB9|nr:uncharacterized protein F5B22DRAFT_272246 [Xylaria bambusicola]KAI0513100.1 hypothetical protein F5B22DRAFT_272246 [Xylaria bambusicola]
MAAVLCRTGLPDQFAYRGVDGNHIPFSTAAKRFIQSSRCELVSPIDPDLGLGLFKRMPVKMVLREFSIKETGAAETRSIPQWSTQHFEATGRPLRIAIDQSNWWYRNITADKEAEIKTKIPGSHPREKRIMDRIFYLLRMNIQLIFVFDGPNRPLKKWPVEYSYSESNIRLLKELLDQLGVPRHDAPGEAAAECVRLQELGVIDAIWTDNTDALMFGGSPTLVQFHKKPEGDQFRNSNTVLVSSAARIKERANLTREWFLMYATLVGCGYTSGLDGFDPTRFFHFAKHSCFQAAANLLAAAVETPLLLSKWRLVVAGIINSTFPEGNIAPPPKSFPDLNALEGCAHPAVSPDEVLRDLPCLRDGWFRSYSQDMVSRYRFLLNNFNTQIHESWVARDLVPIELNHRLRETTTPEQSKVTPFGIEPRPKRKDILESPIVVDPVRVIPELLSAFPSEMYRVINGKRVKIEAPVFRPEEIELLDCVLRRGLPEAKVPKYAPPKISVAKRKPPAVPPKKPANERTRSPVSPLAKRVFTPERPQPQSQPHALRPKPKTKPSLQSLPPLNTHLPVPIALRDVDTSSSPTCIHFHEDLTLPGELDWHNPPLSSSPPMTSSPLLQLPVSRRADVLAGKLSGPGGRKASIAPTSPIPIIKQPAWDHTAGIDIGDL